MENLIIFYLEIFQKFMELCYSLIFKMLKENQQSQVNNPSMLISHPFQVKQQEQLSQEVKIVQKMANKSKNKKGQWGTEENLKYLVFLEFHKEKLQHTSKRKAWAYYKMMSCYLGQRDVDQCRSHHHKMMEKYHKLTDLILDLSLRYQDQQLMTMRENYRKYKSSSHEENYGNLNQKQVNRVKKQSKQTKAPLRQQIFPKKSGSMKNEKQLINQPQLYYEIPPYNNFPCYCHQCYTKYWQWNNEMWKNTFQPHIKY